jgi:hypothetical protein
VIHSYTSPWVNEYTIPDPPVPGAIEWLNNIGKKFDIIIHTTRARTADGQDAVRGYLYANGLDNLRLVTVTDKKLAALVYIDDRAWRFDGTFPTAQQIHRAVPWNKAKPDTSLR